MNTIYLIECTKPDPDSDYEGELTTIEYEEYGYFTGLSEVEALVSKLNKQAVQEAYDSHCDTINQINSRALTAYNEARAVWKALIDSDHEHLAGPEPRHPQIQKVPLFVDFERRWRMFDRVSYEVIGVSEHQ